MSSLARQHQGRAGAGGSTEDRGGAVGDDTLGSARILLPATLSLEYPQARPGLQRQQVTNEATVLPALR